MQSPDVIERMRRAGRVAARRSCARSAPPSCPGDHHRRARRHRATRPASTRGGYPSPLNYQRLPQVAVHLGQRGHLPRHPRQPGAARRRHRQPRRHLLPRRRARRHERHLPRRRRRRRAAAPRARSRASASSAASPRCGPGGRVSDIGRAIEDHAERHGFGVVRAFIGHGIGEKFHTDLQIPHYYDPRRRHGAWSRG